MIPPANPEIPHGKRASILRDWVLSYSVILLLPLVMAFFNHVHARNVLQSEIETVNLAIVENLGANLDSAMRQISYTGEVIYASTECYALRNTASQSALAYASLQMRELFARHCRTNERLSLMAYLPAYDHVITDKAGYTAEGTWRVLGDGGKIADLSYAQWLEPLGRAHGRGNYFISNTMGSDNLGKASLCFTLTLPMNAAEDGMLHLFSCLRIDDILSVQSAMADGVLLAIIDADGSVVHAWNNARAVEGLPPLSLTARTSQPLRLDNEDYIALSVPSNVNGWTFALLTPTHVFASTLRRMVSFSTATLLTALLLGCGLMGLFLKRHYSPVHRILSAIGARQAPVGNEYDYILSTCQSLTCENTSIKDRLRVQEAYIQEKFLLSRLLGRGVRPSDQGIAQRTASLFEGKIIRMAAFCLSLPEDGATQPAEHFDTMQYNVHRLLWERLDGYEPLRVIDNNCVVYLFPLTREQNDAWPGEAPVFTGAVCDAFEDAFHLPLLAVLSNPCERLELCHELYTEVSSVAECLSAAGESGAIPVCEVLQRDDRLKTSRHIAGYKLREAIARGDAAAADQHLLELYGHIVEKSALSFQVTRFLYFNILRLVGKAFDDALPDDAEGCKQVQIQMGELMLCADQDEMEQAVRKFARDTCGYILRHKAAPSEGAARSVREFIERHHTDANLNISHIACALNLSPQTVTKYCKQETSMSVLDYIARIRIDRAKQLAAQSDMTLEELSKAVGYASVRTFHRAYAKLEGTTPGRGLNRGETGGGCPPP